MKVSEISGNDVLIEKCQLGDGEQSWVYQKVRAEHLPYTVVEESSLQIYMALQIGICLCLESLKERENGQIRLDFSTISSKDIPAAICLHLDVQRADNGGMAGTFVDFQLYLRREFTLYLV